MLTFTLDSEENGTLRDPPLENYGWPFMKRNLSLMVQTYQIIDRQSIRHLKALSDLPIIVYKRRTEDAVRS